MKFELLSELLPVEVAAEKKRELINHVKRSGMKVLNIAKGGTLGTSEKVWTDEKILKSARKYKTINGWRSNNLP